MYPMLMTFYMAAGEIKPEPADPKKDSDKKDKSKDKDKDKEKNKEK